MKKNGVSLLFKRKALQADLDRWPVHYNTEHPHLGYRNMGKRPIDTVNAYLSVTKEAS